MEWRRTGDNVPKQCRYIRVIHFFVKVDTKKMKWMFNFRFLWKNAERKERKKTFNFHFSMC